MATNSLVQNKSIHGIKLSTIFVAASSLFTSGFIALECSIEYTLCIQGIGGIFYIIYLLYICSNWKERFRLVLLYAIVGVFVFLSTFSNFYSPSSVTLSTLERSARFLINLFLVAVNSYLCYKFLCRGTI